MKRQHQYLLTIAIISIVGASNFLIYHFLYSYELKVPIHQSVAREKQIENREDAKEVIATETENGAIILGENYYVVDRENEIYVEWWEYLGSYEEIRYSDRGLAYLLWGSQIVIFGFLIFIFSVSRKVGHTEKSVSINS